MNNSNSLKFSINLQARQQAKKENEKQRQQAKAENEKQKQQEIEQKRIQEMAKKAERIHKRQQKRLQKIQQQKEVAKQNAENARKLREQKAQQKQREKEANAKTDQQNIETKCTLFKAFMLKKNPMGWIYLVSCFFLSTNNDDNRTYFKNAMEYILAFYNSPAQINSVIQKRLTPLYNKLSQGLQDELKEKLDKDTLNDFKTRNPKLWDIFTIKKKLGQDLTDEHIKSTRNFKIVLYLALRRFQKRIFENITNCSQIFTKYDGNDMKFIDVILTPTRDLYRMYIRKLSSIFMILAPHIKVVYTDLEEKVNIPIEIEQRDKIKQIILKTAQDTINDLIKQKLIKPKQNKQTGLANRVPVKRTIQAAEKEQAIQKRVKTAQKNKKDAEEDEKSRQTVLKFNATSLEQRRRNMLNLEKLALKPSSHASGGRGS